MEEREAKGEGHLDHNATEKQRRYDVLVSTRRYHASWQMHIRLT